MLRPASLLPVICLLSLFGCSEDQPARKVTLLVTALGSGSGVVSSTPAGIECGATCSTTLAKGAEVTLTATPGVNSTFDGWNGSCSGTAPCTVTVDGDTAVTATFTLRNSLSVSVTGAGGVTSSPGGIDCGTDCTEVYATGTVVNLTATADQSTTFTNWSGDCTDNAACAVTVDQARNVTATFALNSYALDVTRSGTGSGAVTSTAPGIDCGLDCAEDYDHGTSITLTAEASVGSTFAGWSGGGCTGTSPDCVVDLTGNTAVTATFAIDQESVTVLPAGNGSGVITSSPGGIDCGADCGELYGFGTVVTLAATPAPGSTFGGWSGGCTGTAPCEVTVTGPITVTGTFILTQHTMIVARAGSGSGAVTSTPAGINCGTDCDQTFDYGANVTLTAVPAVSATFSGWSGGGCTGIGNCLTTMTTATTVTANFGCPAVPATDSITFNHTGALQTFVVPACVSSITLDASGAEGGTSTGQNGGQNFTGGLGARASGTFAVTGGEEISILVGGAGANGSCGAGGGGGSFATRSNGTLLLAAGGGGGGFHCNAIGGAFGVGGNVTTTGGAGVCGTGLVRNPTPGGSGGNGASAFYGGGGGGFLSPGTSRPAAPETGGGAFPGAGGVPGGGFGGGGGYYFMCCGGSGGGGGFSGGGGSETDGCAGGGGGSSNSGSAQIMTDAFQAGNGTVSVSY